MEVVETPTTQQEETTKQVVDIQRLAWVILTSATLLFCSSTIAVTVGIYYFFFLSSNPMDVTIAVSRGTAGFTASDFSEQIIREQLANVRERSSTVDTDAQSQATFSFRMVGDGEFQPVLATITLENSSSITLARASHPRFRWSDGFYRIEFEDFQGEIDIFVSRAADRPFIIQVHTPTDEAIRIENPGRYSFFADSEEIRFSTREGEASLLSADRQNNRLVTRDQEAVQLVGRGAPFVTESSQNLLENSYFAFAVSPGIQENGNVPPLRWGCTDAPDAPPSGRWTTDLWEGRPALRLIRTGDVQSHGETGCRQEFGGEGRDVTGFTYLELQATFLINFQSLSDCGQVGSECPLILLMEYTDINGDIREWLQGFYSQHDPQRQYPSTCITCGQVYQQHRLINDKVWYTFKTDNLFDLLNPTERPASIQKLEFYASGHQYDVFVSEVVLLAGQSEVIPPNENIVPNLSPTATPAD